MMMLFSHSRAVISSKARITYHWRSYAQSLNKQPVDTKYISSQLQKGKFQKDKNRFFEKRNIVLPADLTAMSLSNTLGVSCVEILKWLIRMGEKPTTREEKVSTALAELIAQVIRILLLKFNCFNISCYRNTILFR
jgi:hypothetical protein